MIFQLNGGMDKLSDLASLTTEIRANLQLTASTRRAIAVDNSLDYKSVHGAQAEQIHTQIKVAPRANFSLPFPSSSRSTPTRSSPSSAVSSTLTRSSS